MIKFHTEADGSPLIQGSDAWKAARCGLLTASEMKLVVTPTLKASVAEKATSHMYELLAQRITRHVEERYINEDMLRGIEDEVEARILYAERYAPVQETGFITNDKWGFRLGYSPDGLVGVEGLIECKSRRQKLQVRDMIENVLAGTVPDDFTIQVQTGLLVSERSWCDLVIYSAGLPMVTIRAHPNEAIQKAILDAAYAFEERIAVKHEQYRMILADAGARLIPTERKVEMEMHT